MSSRIYYSQEAEVQAQRERVVLALIVAGMGITLGMVMALLFAPKTGDETRRELNERLEHIAQRGRETAEQLAHDASRNTAHVRDDLERRLKAMNE